MEHGGAAAASAKRECAARVSRRPHRAGRGARQIILRNLRQTVRGSMRRAHLKTGMLKKRALYWQMLVSILYFSKMVSVTSCPVLSSIGGQTAGPIGLKIGTNTHWNYAIKIGGRRPRVRANVRAAPHIQHRRPKG
jgi:hypothetical protein